MSNSDQPDPSEETAESEETAVSEEIGASEEIEASEEMGASDETAATDDVEAEQTAAAPGRRLRWSVVVPVALLVASLVAFVSVYWFLFRTDQLTNAAAQQQAVAAAREGTEAVLSYSSENLDQSLAAAKSHLTGDFLDHYSKFTDDVVRPAVTEKGVKTEANVARAAVSQMKPGSAQVLVFVNQVTTSRDRPSPALATSTVMVTLVKNGDTWLIAEFKPI